MKDSSTSSTRTSPLRELLEHNILSNESNHKDESLKSLLNTPIVAGDQNRLPPALNALHYGRLIIQSIETPTEATIEAVNNFEILCGPNLIQDYLSPHANHKSYKELTEEVLAENIIATIASNHTEQFQYLDKTKLLQQAINTIQQKTPYTDIAEEVLKKAIDTQVPTIAKKIFDQASKSTPEHYAYVDRDIVMQVITEEVRNGTPLNKVASTAFEKVTQAQDSVRDIMEQISIPVHSKSKSKAAKHEKETYQKIQIQTLFSLYEEGNTAFNLTLLPAIRSALDNYHGNSCIHLNSLGPGPRALHEMLTEVQQDMIFIPPTTTELTTLINDAIAEDAKDGWPDNESIPSKWLQIANIALEQDEISPFGFKIQDELNTIAPNQPLAFYRLFEAFDAISSLYKDLDSEKYTHIMNNFVFDTLDKGRKLEFEMAEKGLNTNMKCTYQEALICREPTINYGTLKNATELAKSGYYSGNHKGCGVLFTRVMYEIALQNTQKSSEKDIQQVQQDCLTLSTDPGVYELNPKLSKERITSITQEWSTKDTNWQRENPYLAKRIQQQPKVKHIITDETLTTHQAALDEMRQKLSEEQQRAR